MDEARVTEGENSNDKSDNGRYDRETDKMDAKKRGQEGKCSNRGHKKE